jgi:hypothetical protein
LRRLAPGEDASHVRRFIARKLVEARIRRRLETLASVYGQHALLGTDRARYERLADDARAFAGTLPSRRVTTWLAIVPVLLALAGPIGGTLSGVSFDRWRLHDGGDIAMAVIYGVGLAIYLGGLLPRAFQQKRSFVGLLVLFGTILGLVAALPFVDDVRDVPAAAMLAGYVPGVLAIVWLRRYWRRRVWR